MYGNTPMLISGVQKSAPSFAITRSHESASPIPPATTWPLAAHSVGLPSRGISRKYSRNRSVPKCLAIGGASEPKPPRSAPAQKALPAPVRTTARASESPPARLIAATSWVSISCERRLRFSGSFRVTVATPSLTSYSTNSSAIGATVAQSMK